MKLSDYLSDKRYLILLYTVVCLFTGAVIYISEASKLLESNGLYVVEVSFLLFVIYLAIDFMIKKRYYDKLRKNLLDEGLDWVNSLPEPLSVEQRIYTQLLQKLYRDANNKLAEHNEKKH